MAKVEQPMFILPKKRNVQKLIPPISHVDHITNVQGVDPDNDKPTKFKNGLSTMTELVVGGMIHSTMEGIKSHMTINLPIIDDVSETPSDPNSSNAHTIVQNNQKNGYQALSYIQNSRELMDLSPIFENSSDGHSSHGDLDGTDEFLKGKNLYSELNDSLCATPNSMSHTYSETSFEMGPLTDSHKRVSCKRKKRVNRGPEIIENEINDSEMTALRIASKESISQECSMGDHKEYLTMTGTIKRGKKKGQNVDVKLNISREELEVIEAAIVAEEYDKMDMSQCSFYNGPHVFLFTLACLPFVTSVSALYSFYMGTMTWYNIFSHVTDELHYMQKAFWAPVVILLYPFLIVVFAAGLGLYAGIAQVTFSGANWWKGVCDFEKGFYGWLCNILNLPECSPYEVVILMDIKPV